MTEDVRRRETFDEYADAFTVTITPFGANLSFSVREAHPSSNKPPQIQHLGTLRMSVEHLKTMVVILRRQILQVENDTGVKADVPLAILNQLQISAEDWGSFWKLP
ncbi:MAG: hypothetical protein HY670_04510 [Chloroflexi bacterium]|nr:hypothetical protein [Chloroflexota bacterium]